jgi:hypothetical protein
VPKDPRRPYPNLERLVITVLGFIAVCIGAVFFLGAYALGSWIF